MDRFAGTSARSLVDRAVAAGHDAFGEEWTPSRVAIAPGRIEILGNHLDYNGGPVLAAAIDRFVAVAAADEGPPGAVRAVAADVPEATPVTVDVTALGDWRNPEPPPQWPDYIRGLLAAAQPRGTVPPASFAIAGNVPIGFGVSSSAALCVALALALVDAPLSPEELALLAQAAEHRAGTPCGTMDQSASVAGGVIAFSGADLSVERLEPTLGDLVFAVIDSGVDRSLGASSYPARVAESRQALEIARERLGIDLPHLAALTADDLASLEHMKALDPVLARRTRHIVEETTRVEAGKQAMQASDWTRFGELMTASGRSSATLYEISHPRVEELVAESRNVGGVLGARMMGGGEGGSALVLLRRGAAPELGDALRSGYFHRYGMADTPGLVHICAFAPGATRIDATAADLAFEAP